MLVRGVPQPVTDLLSSDGGVVDLRVAASARAWGRLWLGLGLHLLTGSTRLRLVVPGVAGPTTTPHALMEFSNDVLRAHAQGARDLRSSYFRVGRDGHGRGVDGFANDGFCARTKRGCAAGTTFFAVGVVGAGPGGAAEVVYDPRVDAGIVAVTRDRKADLTDLVQRALLLTTLGRAGYERAVSNTAHPASNVSSG